MKNFNTIRFRALFFPLVIIAFFLTRLELRAQSIPNPTGNVFQDTEGLKMSIEQKKADMIIKYLKTMGLPTDKTLLQNNSYLKDFFKDDLFNGVNILAIDPATVTATTTSGGVFDALLPPTQTINAIGTFIAKRFQEEINIAYLDKFQAILNDATNKEIRLLFPKTTNIFGSVKPYNYTTFLETLRQAFEKDLEMLPQNTAEVMRSPNITISDNDVKNSIILFLTALQEVTQGQRIMQVLGGIDQKSEVNSLSSNSKNVIQLSALITRNTFYKEIGKDKYAQVKRETIEKITRDANLSSLCFGLFIEKEKNVLNSIKVTNSSNSSVGLYDFLITDKTKVTTILSSISIIINDLDQAKLIAESMKVARENGQKVSFEDYLKYSETIISVLKSSKNIAKIVNIPIDTDVIKILDIGEITFATSRYVYEKKYGLALMSSVQLLEKALPNSPAKTEIIKYGTFMVTMANAKSSDEMVQALETAALPVGSYRIKRNNRFNISINSYAGISAGYEKFNGKDGMFISPSALVGIYVGGGTEQKSIDKSDGSSDGVFLSLIDVGGVFALRLSGDATAVLPEVSWKNVFTPGIYYVHGVKNSPISWGIGFQRAPQLRLNAKENTLNILDVDAWRFGAKLTIDIPLFNIKTRANKN